MENYEVETQIIAKKINEDVDFKNGQICIIENGDLNSEESHSLKTKDKRIPHEDSCSRIPGARKYIFQRRYPCPYCSLMLVSRSNLTKHIRLHTGSRPFLCDICGKEGNTKFDLERHIQSHVQIYDYMCGDCQKSFHSLYTVRKHIKNVHKKHVRDVNHFRIKKKVVKGQEMMFIKAVHKNCNYYKLFYIIES